MHFSIRPFLLMSSLIATAGKASPMVPGYADFRHIDLFTFWRSLTGWLRNKYSRKFRNYSEFQNYSVTLQHSNTIKTTKTKPYLTKGEL